jgi:hypothetical protein
MGKYLGLRAEITSFVILIHALPAADVAEEEGIKEKEMPIREAL